MENFPDILREATANIEAEYFQLPVAEVDGPVYRERVYCYELYHQLRERWPDGRPYSLSGEVDKQGHPQFRGNNLDGTKPDLLVHKPGDMNENAVIIEVKPINGRTEGIEKDLKTLTAFRSTANYQAGYLLIYGTNGSLQRVREIAERCTECVSSGEIDTGLITLWHHASPGDAAQSVPWDNLEA